MNESPRANDDRLDQARALVLGWLRVTHRDSQFLKETAPSELGRYHAMIAQRFLDHVRAAGFHGHVIDTAQVGPPAFEVRWTHHGSSFVGFKQPAPREKAADALLVGCAALLENEWCRTRLPE